VTRAPSASAHVKAETYRPPRWGLLVTIGLLLAGFGRRRTPRGHRVAADSPTERFLDETSAQPKREDWKNIVRRVAKNVSKQRIVLVAAGVTFYTLLAIFPAIAALVALYGLVADPAIIGQHVENLSGLLPGGAIDVLRDQITRIAAEPRGTLGLTFVAGLAVSLWSANGGVKALFDALNVVYVEREKRGFVRLTAVSLAFVAGGILFLLVAVAAVIAVPVALRHLGIPPLGKTIVSIVRWPILFAVAALIIAFVYRFGPDRTNPRWRWISWGSAFAAATWLAVSVLFSWYAANFGNYNETYGSLGAVIGFMTWIWLSAIVILIGAEIDSVLERNDTHRVPHSSGHEALTARGASSHTSREPRSQGPRSAAAA
jgi:membrane protein